MNAAEAAAQSDPDLNRHFRRRWAEPPPQIRKRPVIGGTITRAEIGGGSSNDVYTRTTRLLQWAARLDRQADMALAFGRHAAAEHMSQHAVELREAAA